MSSSLNGVVTFILKCCTYLYIIYFVFTLKKIIPYIACSCTVFYCKTSGFIFIVLHCLTLSLRIVSHWVSHFTTPSAYDYDYHIRHLHHHHHHVRCQMAYAFMSSSKACRGVVMSAANSLAGRPKCASCLGAHGAWFYGCHLDHAGHYFLGSPTPNWNSLGNHADEKKSKLQNEVNELKTFLLLQKMSTTDTSTNKESTSLDTNIQDTTKLLQEIATPKELIQQDGIKSKMKTSYCWNTFKRE